MADISVKTLSNCNIKDIHRCWCRAFSDYSYPLDLSLEELNIRLRQDSFNAQLSLGAFAGEKMVGIWLTGLRVSGGGKKVAYDAGTAVVPEWRRRGISTLLSNRWELGLKRQGVECLLIEVIEDNDNAYSLYKKRGFVKLREFDGYRYLNIPSGKRGTSSIETVSLCDLSDDYLKLLKYEPSWQNTMVALQEVDESAIVVKAHSNGSPCGYCIYQPILRRVAQVAVMDSRKNAITTVLDMFNEIGRIDGYDDKLEVINIPSESSIGEVLIECKMEHFISLHELEKNI